MKKREKLIMEVAIEIDRLLTDGVEIHPNSPIHEKLNQALRQPAVSSSSGVIRQERGWAGHFICANRCRFRRNTLLTYKDIRIVVSTVGLMECDGKIETIGHNRYFETMAFHSDPTDTRYYDADVSKQVYFDSEWAIAEPNADDRANEMHEAVVLEITNKLLAGETFPVTDRRNFPSNGNKHIFKCTCGKEIIVMTNVYDNSNSGKGSCECGAVYYVN